MKKKPLYEISISLYYKDLKKAPKIGTMDMIYTHDLVPTIANIREHFKAKEKVKKYPTKIGTDPKKTKNILDSFNESVSSFRGNVLKVLKGKSGSLDFEENFEGWYHNAGCQIENKDYYIKVWRRELKLTSW